MVKLSMNGVNKMHNIIDFIPLEILEIALFNGWTVYDLLELIFC